MLRFLLATCLIPSPSPVPARAASIQSGTTGCDVPDPSRPMPDDVMGRHSHRSAGNVPEPAGAVLPEDVMGRHSHRSVGVVPEPAGEGLPDDVMGRGARRSCGNVPTEAAVR